MSELPSAPLRSDALEISRRFIDLVLKDEHVSNALLVKALDELAFAYHFSPASEPSDDDIECPYDAFDQYKDLYRRIGERFPELGYYAVADPSEVPAKEPMIGDAIDDLADIVNDLQQVLWRAENVSASDARWYYRMLFEIHWGRHLRELSLYLHDKGPD